MTAFWSPLLRLNEPICSWETAWQVLQFDQWSAISMWWALCKTRFGQQKAAWSEPYDWLSCIVFWYVLIFDGSLLIMSSCKHSCISIIWMYLRSLTQCVAAHACLSVCLDVDAMTRTWHQCMTPVGSMIGTAIIASHRMMTCLRPGRATAKVWWSQSTSKDGNFRARFKKMLEAKAHASRKPVE